MNQNEVTVVYSLRLPEWLYNRVKEESKKHDRSIRWIVEDILKEKFKRDVD